MASSPPLVDQDTESIDRNRVLWEATILAKLIGLVVSVALVPFAFVVALSSHSPLGTIFMVVTQFVLAVGSGVVLIYVISRAIQLANES